MLAIYKREMKSYFSTMLGYIFVSVFLLLTGIFFTINNILQNSVGFAPVLSSVTHLMILLVPTLTMRLIADEKKMKTEQLLFSSPVSMVQIVSAKLLAAFSCLLIALITTVVYPLILMILGNPYIGEIMSGYIGCTLIGVSIISLGVFISSISEDQLSAALLTLGVLLMLWLIDAALPAMSDGIVKSALLWVTPFSRLKSFRIGLITSSSVIYLLSFALAFFLGTILVMEKRRWARR